MQRIVADYHRRGRTRLHRGASTVIETPAEPTDARHAEVVPLHRSALPRDTLAMARFLLGKILVREAGGHRMTGRIAETEAYLQNDPACHAYRGVTPRNRSLFLEAGHAYVYLCYGTSYLLNVSSEECGIGAGVLLRALEPMTGIEHMRQERAGLRLSDLARGPGRLTSAMQVNLTHDGLDLFAPGALWIGTDGTTTGPIGVSTRIGLTKGTDARWRFFLVGSTCLSGSRRLNAQSV